MTKTKEVAVAAPTTNGAINTMAERLGVEATSLFLKSLRDVAFKSPNATNEQLMALVVVSNQYKLNPFTKELYAFPDRGGGIVPIVAVDGWYRIMNEHPAMDGVEYTQATDEAGRVYGEASIYRKDRSRPTVVREYYDEVKRNTDPWKQHGSRMLRHKTIIQAARVAFGFAGIYDPDEGERIIQASKPVPLPVDGKGVDAVAKMLGVNLDEESEASPDDIDSSKSQDDLPL